MYIGACWARLRPGWIVGGPSGEEEEAPGPRDTHLAESSRADRFGRLAEAGPKSEVSEGPKETFSSAGEDFLLHPCRIVKSYKKPYVFH